MVKKGDRTMETLINEFVDEFVEILGWDIAPDQVIKSGDRRLYAIAHKRGVVAYLCAGGAIPNAKERAIVARNVPGMSFMVIFISHDKQSWLWTANGKIAFRDRSKIDTKKITFSLAEEDGLSLLDVVERLNSI